LIAGIIPAHLLYRAALPCRHASFAESVACGFAHKAAPGTGLTDDANCADLSEIHCNSGITAFARQASWEFTKTLKSP